VLILKEDKPMNLRKSMLHLATTVALAATLLAAPAVMVAQHAAKPTPNAATMARQVDINSATADQLRAVPGIGSVYAKRIIASRPYSSKDQLVSKGVLPQGVYDKVKGYLVAHRASRMMR
jgi:competence protein ComEA